ALQLKPVDLDVDRFGREATHRDPRPLTRLGVTAERDARHTPQRFRDGFGRKAAEQVFRDDRGIVVRWTLPVAGALDRAGIAQDDDIGSGPATREIESRRLLRRNGGGERLGSLAEIIERDAIVPRGNGYEAV